MRTLILALIIGLLACNDTKPAGDRGALTEAGWNDTGGRDRSGGGDGTAANDLPKGKDGPGVKLDQPPPGADLCAGLVTDKLAHPMTALARPALLQTVVDPEFKTTIRRISDSQSGVIKPMYSTIPAWNADESYLILYGVGSGHRLHHGKTYQLIKPLPISPPDVEQVYWHPTDPDLFFYVENKTLIRYHVSSGAKDPVHTFTCSGSLGGGADPMYIAWDANVLGLLCGTSGFAYRLSPSTEGQKCAAPAGTGPQAAPSGSLLYLDGKVVDFNMVPLRALDLGSPSEHASLGRAQSGHDIYFGVQFDPGPKGCKEGALVAHDMTDGSCRVIVGPSTGYPYPPSGIHVSAVALKRPGWVVISVVGSHTGKTPLDSEILLANTNPGGTVCRVAHHRSFGKDGPQGYWAEPHPVPSPSGTRILFGSDWGGGASVDSYVIELPGYVP